MASTAAHFIDHPCALNGNLAMHGASQLAPCGEAGCSA
jgi:hypothetical protein